MKRRSKNKMNRRMIYLMSKTWPMEYDKYVEITTGEYPYVNPILDEIFELAKQLKVLKHLRSMWNECYHVRAVVRMEDKYNKTRKRPRQDNKDFINKGSGMGNRSWIRYPRKARKTAWKRFYKLFPKLKPSEDKDV